MPTWRRSGCSNERRRSSAATVWTVLRFLVVCHMWLDAAAAAAATETENYHRHKVLRIRPQNDKQFQAVRKLHERPPTELQSLDFWSEPASFSDTVYLRVNPQQAEQISQLLKSASIPYDVIVDDLQRLIDDHSRQNSEARIATELGIYDSYLTYDEMLAWIEDAVTLCGSRCSIIDIGRSYEGRRLIAVKVTGDSNSDGQRRNKPGVWIDAGIHAREWISHSTALYFIDRLVVDYIFDGTLRTLLDNFDFYVMPCVNPDGYHFTHVANRLWRKTRSVNEGSECRGTDANRNFGFHWGQSGASGDPCSDIYKGSKPFSESESAAVADFILARNSTWKVYLTLHSYFQMWMAPYGYSTSKPDNYAAQISAANAARKAVESVYGTKYKVGSASDVLYRSSGTSRDWAAGVPRIPYVYTVELRDRGHHGFLLPPDQILETGVETWEGVKAMVVEILRLDGAAKSRSAPWRRGHVIGKANWIY